jgi:Flp pilus assembly protein TadG
MEGRDRRRAGREKGISTVEVVILTPVIFGFAVTMVGLSLYAQKVSQVQQAAADVARMASLQAPGSDTTTVSAAAAADLGSMCNDASDGPPLSVSVPSNTPFSVTDTGNDTSVAMLEATVTCRVTEFGLPYTISESFYAPIDTYGGERP